MKKMKIRVLNLIVLLSVSYVTFCQTGYDKNEIEFSYSAFVGQISQNPVDGFILELRANGNALVDLYGIPNVDVGLLYEDADGKKYLGNLRKPVMPYMSNPDSLLALSVYLKEHYSLKNSIYDQLLRQCIVLDDTHDRAYFLLSELRFKRGGYTEDAYFLMSILQERLPKNKEVKRIYRYFEKRVGGESLKPDDFSEYLAKKCYYIIED